VIAPKIVNIPPATSVRIRAQFRAVKTPIAVAIASAPTIPYIAPKATKSSFACAILVEGRGAAPNVIRTIIKAISKKKSPKQISQIPTSTVPTVRFVATSQSSRILALHALLSK